LQFDQISPFANKPKVGKHFQTQRSGLSRPVRPIQLLCPNWPKVVLLFFSKQDKLYLQSQRKQFQIFFISFPPGGSVERPVDLRGVNGAIFAISLAKIVT